MKRQKHARDTDAGAAVYSPWVLNIYDFWVLGLSNSYAWKCPTDAVLLPFYMQNMSADHLDVGVGSGYYLARSTAMPGQVVTLLDLNDHSLQAAAERVSHLKPARVREDVLHPTGQLGDRRFGSISLFYLLHCLPGNMARKAFAVFDYLRMHLAPGGTLYGATILGETAGHNWMGQRLINVYNSKGIFDNRDDSVLGLELALRHHFARVHVWQQGKVALFRAQLPIR